MAQGLPRDRVETYRSPDTTLETGEAGVEDTYVCPLCSASADASSDLYVHLQISHRKSALAGIVLDVADCSGQTRSDCRDSVP